MFIFVETCCALRIFEVYSFFYQTGLLSLRLECSRNLNYSKQTPGENNKRTQPESNTCSRLVKRATGSDAVNVKMVYNIDCNCREKVDSNNKNTLCKNASGSSRFGLLFFFCKGRTKKVPEEGHVNILSVLYMLYFNLNFFQMITPSMKA